MCVQEKYVHVHMPHSFYAFICRQTLRLFSDLGSFVSNAAMNMEMQIPLQPTVSKKLEPSVLQVNESANNLNELKWLFP